MDLRLQLQNFFSVRLKLLVLAPHFEKFLVSPSENHIKMYIYTPKMETQHFEGSQR